MKAPSPLVGEGWGGGAERLPADLPAEPITVAPEPVSATPLLFLAISEMVAAITQPPTMTAPTPATPGQPDADATIPEPKQEATITATEPPALASESAVERTVVDSTSLVETSAPISTATLEPLLVSMDTASLLAVVENRSPGSEQDSLLQTYLASDVSTPRITMFAESLPTPILPAATVAPSAVDRPAVASLSDRSVEPPADAVTLDRVDGTEVSAPVVPDQPQLLATGPVESSAQADEPAAHQHQDSDSYGPIAPNERLWDIAAKVRPDPGISKEHMMKALFKANPQAFSKPDNMNSLKVGATLRIPTLQEIVIYTGSKAANQLLERRQAIETPPAPEPPAPEPTPSPAPAAETPPAPVEPVPSPAPAAETAPEPVGPPAPPAAETLPVPVEPVPSPAPATEAAPEPVGPPAPPAVETPPALEPAPAVPEPDSEPLPPAPAEVSPAPEPVGPPAPPAAETPLVSEPPAPAAETPSVPEPPAPTPESTSPAPNPSPASGRGE